jgi:NAD(P)H-flavin reductase
MHFYPCRIRRVLSLNSTWHEIEVVAEDAVLEDAKAGQFCMLKAEYSPVFLPRPFGIAAINKQACSSSYVFIVESRGKGSAALCSLGEGARLFVTGPLGKGYSECASLPPGRVALVSGGTGLAPLAFFARELAARQDCSVDFFAGFKTVLFDNLESSLLASIPGTVDSFVYSAENAGLSLHLPGQPPPRPGLITAHFSAASYNAVYCCGPAALMMRVASLCKTANVPCYVSMERKMACGVGACLGCAVKTVHGIRHCCKDGPLFPATEVFYDSDAD